MRHPCPLHSARSASCVASLKADSDWRGSSLVQASPERTVPEGHRKWLLVRADGAGASYGLLDLLTSLNTAPVHGHRPRSVEYSAGFAVTEKVRDAITLVPRTAWQAALTTDGDGVSTPTSSRSPPCSTSRRGRTRCVSSSVANGRPPAQTVPLEERDGYRYRSPRTRPCSAPHRSLSWKPGTGPARVEMGSGTPRTPSRPGFPSREYVINTARLQPVAIAADLTAWLLLRDFTESLRGCEPKALRPRLLHVPALNRSGRR